MEFGFVKTLLKRKQLSYFGHATKLQEQYSSKKTEQTTIT